MVTAPRIREVESPAPAPCDDAVLAAGADVDACSFEDLDLAGRDLRRLQLADSRLTRVLLTDVDLRDTRFGEVEGIEHLRGATVRPARPVQLAPGMAAHPGIEVET